MSFKTVINCNECSHEDIFEDLQLGEAKEQLFEQGGSEVHNGFLCTVCTWRHRKNYFAVDVDLKGNNDYQILAVVKDKECFADSRISFGRLPKTGVIVRRITQPEFESLKAFGIPAVEPHTELYFARSKEQTFFYNFPKTNSEPEKDKTEIDGYSQQFAGIIDLSGAVAELLADKLPEVGTPRDIIEYFERER